jgi:6-phosphogluconolactonase
MKPEIKIFETPGKLADHLAIDFQNSIHQAAKFNRNFYVALSGGNTPSLFFKKLASAPYRENIAWQKAHLFWSDERCVLPDHPESNYGMTKINLLDHISVPETNIHRILGEQDPVGEAKRYAQEIKRFLPMGNSGFPRFDWLLLGLGTDGHTASIFPGSDVLEDRKNICAFATHPDTGQKRITLTLPLINHARRVSFLVVGVNKASVVAKILIGTGESKSLPATFVRPVNGILEWYLEKAAGTMLST